MAPEIINCAGAREGVETKMTPATCGWTSLKTGHYTMSFPSRTFEFRTERSFA